MTSKTELQGYKFRGLEFAQHRFQDQRLKKNKRSPIVLKECRNLVEVLHVKSVSPCVKDDVLNFFILSM